MKLHFVSGLFLVLFTCFFSIMSITYQGKEILYEKFHRFLGIILSVASIPLTLGGSLVFILKEHFSDYRISKILTIGLFHRLFAFSLILTSHYNMALGIKEYNMWKFYLYLVTIISCLILMEYKYRVWLKKD